MVRNWIILVLGLALLQTAQAARLIVHVDKAQSELGTPVQLRVSSRIDLNPLDLEPLKKDFEVFSRAVSSETRAGQTHSTLEATLYPLRSGKLLIPALSLGTARSKPLSVDIAPSPARLRAWIAPVAPMEREPTTLNLEIIDDGSLSWETPKTFDAPQLHLASAPVITHMTDPTLGQVHRFHWQLLPLRSGGLSMGFPMLEAYKFGQRLRFPLTPVTFRAQAAPRYLPLHMPIGKPVVLPTPFPRNLRVGQPANWTVDIDAPGLSAEGLRKLLTISPPPGLRLYAPSIQPIKIEGREGLRWQLAFVAEHTQIETFPAFQLPYFDVWSQRIEAITFRAQSLKVSNPFYTQIGWAVGTLLMLLLLGVMLRQAYPYLRGWRLKRQWLAHVAQASDARALYLALTRGAPRAPASLRSYLAMPSVSPEQIRQLQQLRYGSHAPDSSFAQIKQAWRNSCAQLPLKAII